MSIDLSKNEIKTFYNKIHKHLDVQKVKEWIENPLQDPFSKESILLNINKKSKYYILYTSVFEFLSEQGQDKSEILEIMPKNHWLFNESFDPIILNYVNQVFGENNLGYNQEFQNIYKYYIEKYPFVLTNSDIYNEQTFILRVAERMYKNIISIYNDFFQNVLLGRGIFLDSKKLIEYSKRFDQCGDDIEYFYYDVVKTDEYRKKLDKTFVNIHKSMKLISENDKFKDIEFNYETSSSTEPFFEFHQNLIDNISDFIRKIDQGGKYLIHNKQLMNHSFRMDDPLLKILENPKFKDINLENLELPDQTFTDKQFKELKQKQQNLKNAYNVSIQSFKDGTVSESISLPKSPKMKVNGNTVDARVAIIRQNYTDKQYSTLQKEYHKNKTIIEEYKKLIDIGFLNLININRSDIPPRLNNDRNEIKKHDLNGVSPTSCNGNIDVISQNNLDDNNYPLSKLQLMTKVHTRNKKKEIVRTDCFYAPDLYNLIATNIHNNKPVNNPSTGIKIDDEDIVDLMKIINFIEPLRLYPGQYKNMVDEKLNLKTENLLIRESNISDINKFYTFSISRNMLDTQNDDVDIIPLIFFIPSWITIEDSQSTDLTSETVLLNLHTLFQNGKLLSLHMPPYRNINSRNSTFLNPKLKSVNFSINEWVSESVLKNPSKQSIKNTKTMQIEMLRKVNDAILSIL